MLLKRTKNKRHNRKNKKTLKNGGTLTEEQEQQILELKEKRKNNTKEINTKIIERLNNKKNIIHEQNLQKDKDVIDTNTLLPQKEEGSPTANPTDTTTNTVQIDNTLTPTNTLIPIKAPEEEITNPAPIQQKEEGNLIATPTTNPTTNPPITQEQIQKEKEIQILKNITEIIKIWFKNNNFNEYQIKSFKERPLQFYKSCKIYGIKGIDNNSNIEKSDFIDDFLKQYFGRIKDMEDNRDSDNTSEQNKKIFQENNDIFTNDEKINVFIENFINKKYTPATLNTIGTTTDATTNAPIIDAIPPLTNAPATSTDATTNATTTSTDATTPAPAPAPATDAPPTDTATITPINNLTAPIGNAPPTITTTPAITTGNETPPATPAPANNITTLTPAPTNITTTPTPTTPIDTTIKHNASLYKWENNDDIRFYLVLGNIIKKITDKGTDDITDDDDEFNKFITNRAQQPPYVKLLFTFDYVVNKDTRNNLAPPHIVFTDNRTPKDKFGSSQNEITALLESILKQTEKSALGPTKKEGEGQGEGPQEEVITNDVDNNNILLQTQLKAPAPAPSIFNNNNLISTSTTNTTTNTRKQKSMLLQNDFYGDEKEDEKEDDIEEKDNETQTDKKNTRAQAQEKAILQTEAKEQAQEKGQFALSNIFSNILGTNKIVPQQQQHTDTQPTIQKPITKLNTTLQNLRKSARNAITRKLIPSMRNNNPPQINGEEGFEINNIYGNNNEIIEYTENMNRPSSLLTTTPISNIDTETQLFTVNSFIVDFSKYYCELKNNKNITDEFKQLIEEYLKPKNIAQQEHYKTKYNTLFENNQKQLNKTQLEEFLKEEPKQIFEYNVKKIIDKNPFEIQNRIYHYLFYLQKLIPKNVKDMFSEKDLYILDYIKYFNSVGYNNNNNENYEDLINPRDRGPFLHRHNPIITLYNRLEENLCQKQEQEDDSSIISIETNTQPNNDNNDAINNTTSPTQPNNDDEIEEDIEKDIEEETTNIPITTPDINKTSSLNNGQLTINTNASSSSIPISNILTPTNNVPISPPTSPTSNNNNATNTTTTNNNNNNNTNVITNNVPISPISIEEKYDATNTTTTNNNNTATLQPITTPITTPTTTQQPITNAIIENENVAPINAIIPLSSINTISNNNNNDITDDKNKTENVAPINLNNNIPSLNISSISSTTNNNNNIINNTEDDKNKTTKITQNKNDLTTQSNMANVAIAPDNTTITANANNDSSNTTQNYNNNATSTSNNTYTNTNFPLSISPSNITQNNNNTNANTDANITNTNNISNTENNTNTDNISNANNIATTTNATQNINNITNTNINTGTNNDNMKRRTTNIKLQPVNTKNVPTVPIIASPPNNVATKSSPILIKEEEEQRLIKEAEEQRLIKEAEEQRLIKEAEEQRLIKEAEEQRLIKEAEEQRLTEEAEQKEKRKKRKEQRLIKEAEEQRLIKEAEEQRLIKEAEEQRLIKEAEEQRLIKEAEEQRLIEQQEEEEQRLIKQQEENKINSSSNLKNLTSPTKSSSTTTISPEVLNSYINSNDAETEVKNDNDIPHEYYKMFDISNYLETINNDTVVDNNIIQIDTNETAKEAEKAKEAKVIDDIKNIIDYNIYNLDFLYKSLEIEQNTTIEKLNNIKDEYEKEKEQYKKIIDDIDTKMSQLAPHQFEYSKNFEELTEKKKIINKTIQDTNHRIYKDYRILLFTLFILKFVMLMVNNHYSYFKNEEGLKDFNLNIFLSGNTQEEDDIILNENMKAIKEDNIEYVLDEIIQIKKTLPEFKNTNANNVRSIHILKTHMIEPLEKQKINAKDPNKKKKLDEKLTKLKTKMDILIKNPNSYINEEQTRNKKRRKEKLNTQTPYTYTTRQIPYTTTLINAIKPKQTGIVNHINLKANPTHPKTTQNGGNITKKRKHRQKTTIKSKPIKARQHTTRKKTHYQQ